jgi:hypothetical protein
MSEAVSQFVIPAKPHEPGPSRNLEVFGFVLYFWIPDLAIHRIARPE